MHQFPRLETDAGLHSPTYVVCHPRPSYLSLPCSSFWLLLLPAYMLDLPLLPHTRPLNVILLAFYEFDLVVNPRRSDFTFYQSSSEILLNLPSYARTERSSENSPRWRGPDHTTIMCDYTQVEFRCGHVRYTVRAWCTSYETTHKRCPPTVVAIEFR